MTEQSIKLKVNGTLYKRFGNISVQKSIEDASGHFQFKASDATDKAEAVTGLIDKQALDASLFPVKEGDAVEVIINDTTIIDGWVDGKTASQTAEGNEIIITGRDKTSDFIDSCIPADTLKFTTPTTLPDIISKIIERLGLTGIGVINETDDKLEFSEADSVEADIGTRAYMFVQDLAKKKNVMLTSDSTGNIVLTRAGEFVANIKLQRLQNNNANNLRASTLVKDNRNRFHTYTIHSQPSTENVFSLSPEEASGVSATTTDNEIREGRVYEAAIAQAADEQTLKEYVKWLANRRRIDSFKYNVVKRGFTDDDGVVLAPNMLIQVEDSFAGVNAKLLIRSLQYEYGANGSILKMQLTYPDAYTPQPELPKEESDVSEFGF